MNKLTDENARLLQQVKDLRSELEMSRRGIADLNGVMKTLENAKASLTTNLAVQNQHCQQQQVTIDTMRKTLCTTQQQLTEARKTPHTTPVEANTHLLQQVKDLESELATSRKTINDSLDWQQKYENDHMKLMKQIVMVTAECERERSGSKVLLDERDSLVKQQQIDRDASKDAVSRIRQQHDVETKAAKCAKEHDMAQKAILTLTVEKQNTNIFAMQAEIKHLKQIVESEKFDEPFGDSASGGASVVQQLRMEINHLTTKLNVAIEDHAVEVEQLNLENAEWSLYHVDAEKKMASLQQDLDNSEQQCMTQLDHIEALTVQIADYADENQNSTNAGEIWRFNQQLRQDNAQLVAQQTKMAPLLVGTVTTRSNASVLLGAAYNLVQKTLGGPPTRVENAAAIGVIVEEEKEGVIVGVVFGSGNVLHDRDCRTVKAERKEGKEVFTVTEEQQDHTTPCGNCKPIRSRSLPYTTETLPTPNAPWIVK